MKKMYATVPALLFLLALAVFGCTTQHNPNTPAPTPTPVFTPTPGIDGYYSMSAAGVTFKWKVNGADLDCKVSAATTGWVAVGFNSTGMMDGADFKIGYVTGGSTANIRDDFGSGQAHSQDTTPNLSNIAGTEASGITEITFTIPLNSGDTQDHALSQGGAVYVLTAYGSVDDYTTQHTAFGAAQITLY